MPETLPCMHVCVETPSNCNGNGNRNRIPIPISNLIPIPLTLCLALGLALALALTLALHRMTRSRYPKLWQKICFHPESGLNQIPRRS